MNRNTANAAIVRSVRTPSARPATGAFAIAVTIASCVSAGGIAIAALFAARQSERVHRLVLAAPSIGLPRKTFTAHLLPVMKASVYTRPQFLPRLLWDTACAGPVTLLRTARELLAMDVRSELASIAAPCFLIWGQRDHLVPARLGNDLKKAIPNSSLAIIPRAGHVLMCERPAEFNDHVLRFL